jgi:glycosyltransferase involved in cell wall biosynthesis
VQFLGFVKVLILSSSDILGGAARSAYRLYKGLGELGIEKQMLVQRKFSDDKTVMGPGNSFGKGIALIRPYLDRLPLCLYRKRSEIIFSPSLLPDFLLKKISYINPDIVHLHWICDGFIKIESLKRIKVPLIWTLHDSWAFTGGCHIPFDCTRYQESCGKCPNLGSTHFRDISRLTWYRKKRSWKNLDITVVTPSRWLAECALSSSLFHNARVKVIPNGIALSRFRPIEKKIARDLLSLPMDRKFILFGALSSTSDVTKGFHFLLPAMQELSKNNATNTELIVFGSSEPYNAPEFPLKVHYLGVLSDEIAIALLYSAADVFVLPSLQENLPNTILEAMACGTPAVAFNIGGIPDLIEHEYNGYLARPFETSTWH